MAGGGGQNIQVFIRSRPLKSNERKSAVDVVSDRNEVRFIERSPKVCQDAKNFQYDRVFDQQANQSEVYTVVVKPLIDQVLLGFNCTVFAYGQTGTGKTYTMEGDRSDEEISWEDDPHSGIIPRAISQLFDTLRDRDTGFTVRVSFLELYNEDAYDLLSPLDDTTKLKIFDDAQKKGSVKVGGLAEIDVKNKRQIYDILQKGSAKRQTAATLLNAASSRSHTIFSVTVHIKENSLEGEELLKIGKLNLVDLAGSENIGRSGAQDKRAREAGSINQSLLALGRVITALVERRPHVPYRESKLTRLLQDSLGGKTKTSIIATISPASLDFEDTLSTLEYASRAKKITNKPEMNQKLTKKALIREYEHEIERLRRDLQATREKNGIIMNEQDYNELTSIKQAYFDKQDQIKYFESEIEKYKTLDEEIELTKAELNKAKEFAQRQEELIKSQWEVEKRLKKANKELVHVAKSITTDNDLLHAKKERCEITFQQNQAMLARFGSDISQEIKLIINDIENIFYEREADMDRMRREMMRISKEMEGFKTKDAVIKSVIYEKLNRLECRVDELCSQRLQPVPTGVTPQKKERGMLRSSNAFNTTGDDSILEEPEE